MQKPASMPSLLQVLLLWTGCRSPTLRPPLSKSINLPWRSWRNLRALLRTKGSTWKPSFASTVLCLSSQQSAKARAALAEAGKMTPLPTAAAAATVMTTPLTTPTRQKRQKQKSAEAVLSATRDHQVALNRWTSATTSAAPFTLQEDYPPSTAKTKEDHPPSTAKTKEDHPPSTAKTKEDHPPSTAKTKEDHPSSTAKTKEDHPPSTAKTKEDHPPSSMTRSVRAASTAVASTRPSP